MQDFDVLFDRGEPRGLDDPAYAPYGPLSFPEPWPERPWIFANFVQSLDGIASLKGRHAAGADISQSKEDRWLMDLLRAHADGVLLGINTLIEETNLRGDRGPVFRIMDPVLYGLRQRLGLGQEKNIFVTGSARVDLSRYRVFDGNLVEATIITTSGGAARLAEKKSHPHVRVLVAGEGDFVDLPAAMAALRREWGIRRLICEGGPTLYGYMARAGLIDEKFVTVSPVEVGQIIPPEQQPSEAEQSNPPRRRPTTFEAPGFTKENATWWTWLSCRRVGDHQFSRYRTK
jgi:5-amino-6-(5-phosphoribosylamino)uracil reductase